MVGGAGVCREFVLGAFFSHTPVPLTIACHVPESSARVLLLCYCASASPTCVLHARLLLVHGRGEGSAVVRIQTVQAGIQTGIQTVVKYIQTRQAVKDNQFL